MFTCGDRELSTINSESKRRSKILVFTTLYHCHHFNLLKQSLFSSNFKTSVCVIFAVFWYPRDTPCWYGPQAWRAKTGSKWGKRNLVMGERQLKINVKGNNCNLNLPTTFPQNEFGHELLKNYGKFLCEHITELWKLSFNCQVMSKIYVSFQVKTICEGARGDLAKWTQSSDIGKCWKSKKVKLSGGTLPVTAKKFVLHHKCSENV